jgi:aryl-alcohol dehydrogenase-like predicted oxidoreductase
VRIAEAAAEVAATTGRSASQVALSWVRQQPFGVIVPIVGARTVAQLQDNLGCLNVTLAPEQLARLDAASRIELGFPHDFLVSARSYIFGKTFPLIDNHRA